MGIVGRSQSRAEFVLPVGAVIPSIGTSANPLLAQTTPNMQFNGKGYIVVESEKTGRTTRKGVFASGDIVTGVSRSWFDKLTMNGAIEEPE